MADNKKLCMSCMNKTESDGPCEACGFDELNNGNPDGALKLRTLVAKRYIIGCVIDSNGEGITYKGYDCNTDTPVRIREFYPANLCKRDADGNVAPNFGDEAPFEAGKIAFEDLAKSLSHLNDLPSLVPVTDFFTENGTAYYVTETFVGITLREFLMRNNGSLKWEQIKPLFLPIMSTVKALHSAGIIHMGISPDTVMVCRDGRLRLIGFCIKEARTARNSINEQLYPGFAAIEQYGSDGNQGPWTDVYGFAATIYRTLVGNPPMKATERVTNDNMTIPAKVAESLPKQVMVALANALEILPEDRTQSMVEFRNEVLLSDGEPVASPQPKKIEKNSKPTRKKKKGFGFLYGIIAALITAIIILVVVIIFWDKVLGPMMAQNSSSDNESVVSTSSVIVEDPSVPCTVPSFLHMNYKEVMEYEEYKQKFNLVVVKFDYNDEGFASGEVYKQFPEGEAVVNKGSEVQLYVSLGPKPVLIPDLTGKTYDEALQILTELGFAPEKIFVTYGVYPDVPFSTVYYQDTKDKKNEEGKVSPETEVYLRINESQNSVSSIPATNTSSTTSGTTVAN